MCLSGLCFGSKTCMQWAGVGPWAARAGPAVGSCCVLCSAVYIFLSLSRQRLAIYWSVGKGRVSWCYHLFCTCVFASKQGMAGDTGAAQRRWELENDLAQPQQDAVADSYYRYDLAEQQQLQREKPWSKDPHYFKRCGCNKRTCITL